jgi:uncharacterized membrane protein
VRERYRFRKPHQDFLSEFRAFTSDPRFGTYFCAMAVVLHLINTVLIRNNIAQIPLGLFSVFFAPGYLWLDVLSGRNRLTERSERLMMAVALSVALVILSVTLLSVLLKIPLTPASVVSDIAVICALGLVARKIFLNRPSPQK